MYKFKLALVSSVVLGMTGCANVDAFIATANQVAEAMMTEQPQQRVVNRTGVGPENGRFDVILRQLNIDPSMVSEVDKRSLEKGYVTNVNYTSITLKEKYWDKYGVGCELIGVRGQIDSPDAVVIETKGCIWLFDNWNENE